MANNEQCSEDRWSSNELTAALQQLNGPSDLLPLVQSFADLSSGTEFSSYKEPQWHMLLSGGEISAFVMHSKTSNDNDVTSRRPCFDGCVLRARLRDNTVGFGMVLVRPSKRGTGIAKALLRKAMATEVNDEGCDARRFVLAVCSTLGQPLYRKLGFMDAGTITAVTCLASDFIQVACGDDESSYVVDGRECTRGDLDLLIGCDVCATGISRRDRIEAILDGSYVEGSRSSVAFVRGADDAGGADEGCSVAVARRDCADGPLVIGPMRGKEECCIPLMRALIEYHFRNDAQEGVTDNTNIVMMVTGHPNLVRTLLEIRGMSKLWEWPSMSSDGRPVYEGGDGSYLAMMHPTLG